MKVLRGHWRRGVDLLKTRLWPQYDWLARLEWEIVQPPIQIRYVRKISCGNLIFNIFVLNMLAPEALMVMWNSYIQFCMFFDFGN